MMNRVGLQVFTHIGKYFFGLCSTVLYPSLGHHDQSWSDEENETPKWVSIAVGSELWLMSHDW